MLASLVGIPMLLAAAYLQRRKAAIERRLGAAGEPPDPAAVEAEMQAAGKKAGRLFWITALASCLFMTFALGYLLDVLYVDTRFRENLSKFSTGYLLIVEFFCCLVITSVANGYCRRQDNPALRIGIVAAALLFWTVFQPVLGINPLGLLRWLYSGVYDLDSIRPVVSAWTFAGCWLAVHYWRNFLEQPTRRNIGRALGALVLGAVLYVGAERYGNLAHFHLHGWTRGEFSPAPWQVNSFRTY